MNRSILFAGPPGTGKSVGVRQLIHALNMSSLRVDLTVLTRNDSSSLAFLETALKIMRPDVLVIDDFDRLGDNNPRLFEFLELANRTCRVVMATANCLDEVEDALLRPGRFDDHVIVNKADWAVCLAMVDGDEDLADKLCQMPLAFVAEFVKRFKTLGRDQAMKELPKLLARAEKQQTDEYEEEA